MFHALIFQAAQIIYNSGINTSHVALNTFNHNSSGLDVIVKAEENVIRVEKNKRAN